MVASFSEYFDPRRPAPGRSPGASGSRDGETGPDSVLHSESSLTFDAHPLVGVPSDPSALQRMHDNEVAHPASQLSLQDAEVIRNRSLGIAGSEALRERIIERVRDSVILGEATEPLINRALLSSLVTAVRGASSLRVRALATDTLAEYAVQPGDRELVKEVLGTHGLALEQLLETFYASPSARDVDAPVNGVSASIRLAEALKVDSGRLRRILARVALDPEVSMDLRAISFQALESRQGEDAVEFVGRLATGAVASTPLVRRSAIQALGLVSGASREDMAHRFLEEVIQSVPARHTAVPQEQYSEDFGLGCAAIEVLLSQPTAQRVRRAVIALGHPNKSFQERIAQNLLDVHERGIDVVAPVLHWMDRSSNPVAGLRLLSRVKDSIVVPLLLREMRESSPYDGKRLRECVGGLIRNAPFMREAHVEDLRSLMLSDTAPVRESATEVYAQISAEHPQALSVCRHALLGRYGPVSERMAHSAVAALVRGGRADDMDFIDQLWLSPKMPYVVRRIAKRAARSRGDSAPDSHV